MNFYFLYSCLLLVFVLDIIYCNSEFLKNTSQPILENNEVLKIKVKLSEQQTHQNLSSKGDINQYKLEQPVGILLTSIKTGVVNSTANTDTSTIDNTNISSLSEIDTHENYNNISLTTGLKNGEKFDLPEVLFEDLIHDLQGFFELDREVDNKMSNFFSNFSINSLPAQNSSNITIFFFNGKPDDLISINNHFNNSFGIPYVNEKLEPEHVKKSKLRKMKQSISKSLEWIEKPMLDSFFSWFKWIEEPMKELTPKKIQELISGTRLGIEDSSSSTCKILIETVEFFNDKLSNSSSKQVFVFEEDLDSRLLKENMNELITQMKFFTESYIRETIYVCGQLSLNWSSELSFLTEEIFKLLNYKDFRDKLKSEIVNVESKLIMSHFNSKYLLSKKSKISLNKEISLKFSSPEYSTIQSYQKLNSEELIKERMKRVQLIKKLDLFMEKASKYDHFSICDSTGFETSRLDLINILKSFRDIIESDIGKIEISLSNLNK